MYAARNAVRAAPRAATRFSARAVRPQPSLLSRVAAPRLAWTRTAPRLASFFHTCDIRRQEQVQEELVAKLQNEIALEEDMREDADGGQNIREYLEQSAFEIEDRPGHQEVALTRTYQKETIRVTFTIADLNSNASNSEDMEDGAMYDNEVDGLIGDAQSGGANSKGAINQGKTSDGNIRVAPEDKIAPADREELDDEFVDDEGGQQGFPARTNIRIEKQGKGTLAIEAIAQDGDFLIEDILYFPEIHSADPPSAENEWQKRALYTGPPFGNLDEDLQVLLEKYLEERGINTRMALFIPDYIDHKEQKEYVRWLNNVKTFVE